MEPAPDLLVTPSVRLTKQLGRGGMASVWLADHLTLRTTVVVKFMMSELLADPAVVSRFEREAATAAQVRSPHVVQMLDFGVLEGVPFIVMEHLVGEDLGERLAREGSLPLAEVVTIVTQLAQALTSVHARGILHRDIKPANVFLCEHDGATFVKLLDFGVAKAPVGLPYEATKYGALVGTPPYMSPEHLASEPLDHRTDLWAVGVLAFEALTGAVPFKGSGIIEMVLLLCEPVVPPRITEVAPTLPVALDAWFGRACAWHAAERFTSATELAGALARAAGQAEGSAERGSSSALQGARGATRGAATPRARVGESSPRAVAPAQPSPPARRLWPGVLAGGLVVALVGGAWLARSRGASPPRVPAPVAVAERGAPTVSAASAPSATPDASLPAAAPSASIRAERAPPSARQAPRAAPRAAASGAPGPESFDIQ